MSKLTHLDDSGNARMVDVGDKQETLRVARAEARVRMAAETLHLVETGGHKKGDVFASRQLILIRVMNSNSCAGKTMARPVPWSVSPVWDTI